MSDSLRKALVLPGGGVLGMAWEIGFLAGLDDAGVDLTDADYVLATSAGAVVAMQWLTVPLHRLYADQLHGTAAPEPVLDGVDVPKLIDKHYAVVGAHPDADEGRRIIGRWSLARDRVPERERLDIIERRLPSTRWPDKPLGITAIRADTGLFVIFDKDSGVSLVDAVAASCSVPEVWPAVSIAGVRYYDGGIRSNTNIDMVRDYDRVLALRVSDHLPDATDVVDVTGEDHVMQIVLDGASKKAYGADPLDPRLRSGVALAGFEQGRRAAVDVGAFWR